MTGIFIQPPSGWNDMAVNGTGQKPMGVPPPMFGRNPNMGFSSNPPIGSAPQSSGSSFEVGGVPLNIPAQTQPMNPNPQMGGPPNMQMPGGRGPGGSMGGVPDFVNNKGPAPNQDMMNRMQEFMRNGQGFNQGGGLQQGNKNPGMNQVPATPPPAQTQPFMGGKNPGGR